MPNINFNIESRPYDYKDGVVINEYQMSIDMINEDAGLGFSLFDSKWHLDRLDAYKEAYQFLNWLQMEAFKTKLETIEEIRGYLEA